MSKLVRLEVEESIAVVTFDNPPASVTEIFDKGESAMHRAKASGKAFAVCA